MLSNEQADSAGGAIADADGIGREIFDLAATISPICRSITGKGVGDTLAVLRNHLPIETRELVTGSTVQIMKVVLFCAD